MTVLRIVAVLLAAVVCVVEARALSCGGTPGIVVVPSDTRAEPPAATLPVGVEAAFFAHMTSDDVARGVYGLAGETSAVALTTEQRAAIAPLLADGEALRARLGELREARRAARAAWLAGGAAMVEAVGVERARRAATGGGGAR